MKKIRELILYIAAISAYNFIRILPGGAVPVLARIIARLGWLVPGVKKLVCANIRCAFPDWDEKKVRKTGFVKGFKG